MDLWGWERMQKDSGCSLAQDGGNSDRIARKGRRKGKGIEIHPPSCGPLQFFSRGCAYLTTGHQLRAWEDF